MTIYTLTDPRNGHIFYVGATGHPLKNRLMSGYGCGTYISLIAEGLAPLIEEVEECERSERADRESYWVQQFKAWGFQVENIHYNNLFFFTGRKAKSLSVDQWAEKRRAKAIEKLQFLIEVIKDETDLKLANKVSELAKELHTSVYNKVKHKSRYQLKAKQSKAA